MVKVLTRTWNHHRMVNINIHMRSQLLSHSNNVKCVCPKNCFSTDHTSQCCTSKKLEAEWEKESSREQTSCGKVVGGREKTSEEGDRTSQGGTADAV